MELVNGGDLDAALGLLNGPGIDANGHLASTSHPVGKNSSCHDLCNEELFCCMPNCFSPTA